MQRLLLSSFLSIALCSSFTAEAQQSTVIGGHVKDSANFDLSVNAVLYPLDLVEGNAVTIVPKLDKNKDFSTAIGFDRPFYVRYVSGGRLLKGTYVMPGDKIKLDIADGSTVLSGTNQKLLTFLGRLEPYFENAELEAADTTGFKTMGRVEFMKHQQARRDRQLRYVIEYFVGLPPLDQQMRRLLEADINYSFALKMLRYSRSAGKDKRFVFRYHDYMSAIEEVIASDPEALISMAYAEFIYQLPYSIWHAEVNWSMTDKPPYEQLVADEYKVRDSIAKKYFEGEVYELALYAILLDAVKDAAKARGTAAFEKAYMDAHRLIAERGRAFTNKLYYTRLMAKLEDLQQPGKPEKAGPPSSKPSRKR
jgi:hypothetical protein